MEVGTSRRLEENEILAAGVGIRYRLARILGLKYRVRHNRHGRVYCGSKEKMTNEEKEGLKKKLTEEQYKVLIEKETEKPFTGKYVKESKDGIYACVLCGNQLFSSNTKFDSGTGWPSFDEAIPGAIKQVEDNSLSMKRTEIVCAKCDSHLGHVFDDGLTKTGKRYCLNSVCLNLEDK